MILVSALKSKSLFLFYFLELTLGLSGTGGLGLGLDNMELLLLLVTPGEVLILMDPSVDTLRPVAAVKLSLPHTRSGKKSVKSLYVR